jgi:hypothetical protein
MFLNQNIDPQGVTELPTTDSGNTDAGTTDFVQDPTEMPEVLERQTEGGFHPVQNPDSIPEELIQE